MAKCYQKQTNGPRVPMYLKQHLAGDYLYIGFLPMFYYLSMFISTIHPLDT